MEIIKVWSNEIEGRLDCFFYSYKNKHSLQSTYQIVLIGDVTTEIIHPPEYKRQYSNSGYQLIRAQNVRTTGLDLLSNPVFFDKQTLLNKRIIFAKVGDVLVVRSGVNTGDCAVIDKQYDNLILGADTLVCRCKPELNPNYLKEYISSQIGKSYLRRYITGATNSHITPDNLKKIPIPLPPLSIQNEIVSMMNIAYQKKREMEAEAEQILNSIDNYLISMLGLKIPDIINKMCFTVMSDEVVNGRLDAEYYNTNYESFIKCLKMSNFEYHFLYESLLKITSGQRPKGGVGNIKEGIPSIGGEHIQNDGYISSNNMRFIPKDFHEKHLDSVLKINDILIIKDGATTGKVGILQEDYPFSDININEHVFLLRCKKSVNPYYIFCVLKSSIGQIQIKRSITGATVTGIIRKSIMDIIIPLPPIEIQNQIALEVKNRIEQATKLKEEAKKILESAKTKINSLLTEGSHEV